MTLTLSEIEEALSSMDFEEEYQVTPWFGAEPKTHTGRFMSWGGLDEYLRLGADRAFEVEGVGVVRKVEGVGGFEGDGDYVHRVFSVEPGDGTIQYYKKEGSYTSYDGIDWDGNFYEVEPAEKTVTVYERTNR